MVECAECGEAAEAKLVGVGYPTSEDRGYRCEECLPLTGASSHGERRAAVRSLVAFGGGGMAWLGGQAAISDAVSAEAGASYFLGFLVAVAVAVVVSRL
jgi:hypothetical protein